MTLKKLLRTSAAALGALAVASVGQANAADIYTAPSGGYPSVYIPPIWTGFYFGAHAGVDWTHFDINQHRFEDEWWDGDVLWTNSTIIPKNSLNSTGGFIGGQFGYNWQPWGSTGLKDGYTPSPWLVGIEVDLGAMTVNNRFHNFGPMADPRVAAVMFDNNNNNDFNFYGDVTGRLGYTWGSAMIYAKGGFAFLENNFNMRETIAWSNGGTSTFNNNNNNNTNTGWVLGGGVEWKVSPAWSIKAEYLHFDFSNNNNNCCDDSSMWWDGHTNNFNNNNNLTIDTVKVGFNYFWNPAPPAPLK